MSPKIFESILVSHAQVSEAAAVGVPDPIKGEALVCFCVLKKNVDGDNIFASELKETVARDLGKALAPRKIIFVGDTPKTRNAKVMRRIARPAYLGEKLGTRLCSKTLLRWMKSSERQDRAHSPVHAGFRQGSQSP